MFRNRLKKNWFTKLVFFVLFPLVIILKILNYSLLTILDVGR